MHHDGHQRARKQVAGHHGEDHRQRQGHEQVERRSVEEHHRHEHDADGQGRHEGRHGDLLRAVEHSLGQRLVVDAEVAVDVFQFHRGVVHEDADGEREAAQRHHVECVPERVEQEQRHEDGQRDRHGDDERRAPASQEDEDHHGRQARGDERLLEHAVLGVGDEHGLIEELLGVEARREPGLDLLQTRFDAVDDVHRAGAAAFEHAQQRGALAVLAHDVGLHREAVVDLRHVAHVDCRAVDDLDRQVVEAADDIGTAIELHQVLALIDFHRAGGQGQVLGVERVGNILGRDAVGVHRLRVDVHHDLPRLAAVGQRHAGALHGGELLADEVEVVVVEFLLGERLAGDRELEYRHAAGAVTDDQRRRDVGRQNAQDRLLDAGHLGDGLLNLDVGLEVDLDDAHAVHGLALHVLDAVDRRGHGAFGHVDDALLHVVGRDARVRPDDADDRDVDLREDVRGHREERQDAQHEDEHGHHHEGVGPA